MIALVLVLAGAQSPAPDPAASMVPPAPPPGPEASQSADVTITAEPPRDGEIIRPPYGSRVGEHREGEVWKPINPPTYEKQPVPSEAAVSGQSNPELTDTLAKKKPPPTTDTPQRFALEVKLGPYRPDVDANYTGEGFGPYAKIFGETDDRGITNGPAKKSVYGAVAFEWQITKKLAGPIGLGVQWSMMRDTAQAPIAEPPAEGSTRSAADKVKFGVMPIALQVVYRFELLADKVRWAPFVPYVKAGVAYAFWWAKNGNNDIAVIKQDGKVVDRGRGGVWGYQINLGMMLRLDFLDPGTAKRFDRVSGINHTYIVGEWQLTRLANFGRKDSMNVSDSTWLLGLAMEF